MSSNPPPSDGTIVDAVLCGDRDQFALLVDRYETALLRMVESRLGRRDWAEDVVQEAFLCAFKSLHTYNSQFSFRTWLWTIVLNQCHRHFQRRSRSPQVSAWGDWSKAHTAAAEPDPPSGDETSPAELLLAKERHEQLHDLLRQLPEEQADALRLRFFGELKFHEIAAAMGCSLSSAKNRVRWGLTKMSQMLSRAECDSPLAGEPK